MTLIMTNLQLKMQDIHIYFAVVFFIINWHICFLFGFSFFHVSSCSWLGVLLSLETLKPISKFPIQVGFQLCIVWFVKKQKKNYALYEDVFIGQIHRIHTSYKVYVYLYLICILCAYIINLCSIPFLWLLLWPSTDA